MVCMYVCVRHAQKMAKHAGIVSFQIKYITQKTIKQPLVPQNTTLSIIMIVD